MRGSMIFHFFKEELNDSIERLLIPVGYANWVGFVINGYKFIYIYT